jgi:signal transduction histidine kinase
MASLTLPARPRGWAALFGGRRLAVTLGTCAALIALFSTVWESSIPGLAVRVVGVGLLGMTVFGIFEQWPTRLPKWLARWVLQVLAVGLTMPLAWFVIYVLSTEPGALPFWRVEKRAFGFGMLTGFSVLVAPWVALGALVRQREAFAREQALAFELERSQLEREASDARLRLLQAQVQPHFLFNTLANVRALVRAGSAQAPKVLDHLIDYLRAAVPRLNEPTTTLGQEVQLVRAYLELMLMRMPDRMCFTLEVDDAALSVICPPMTLMTLVENAVRHGIDPAEEGGRIDVEVRLSGAAEPIANPIANPTAKPIANPIANNLPAEARCHITVRDTGVGLQRAGDSLGTGLTSLRERLRLSFGGDAQLRVSAIEPHGVCAELDFPARHTVARVPDAA